MPESSCLTVLDTADGHAWGVALTHTSCSSCMSTPKHKWPLVTCSHSQGWGPFQRCRLLLGLLLHFCFAYLCHFWRSQCTLPLISGWKTRPTSLKGALIHSKCAAHVTGQGEQCCSHSLCCSRVAKSLVDAAGASCASHHLSPLGTALETWGGVLLLICWFF